MTSSAHASDGLSLLCVAIPGVSCLAALHVKYAEAMFDGSGWSREAKNCVNVSVALPRL